jgi:hypothetical protein
MPVINLGLTHILNNTVCPPSVLGVFNNFCGRRLDIPADMLHRTWRARILSGHYPCYPGSPHWGLLRSIKDFQSFPVICCKLHVSSSICLHAKTFKNPKQTLWTHCTSWLMGSIHGGGNASTYVQHGQKHRRLLSDNSLLSVHHCT